MVLFLACLLVFSSIKLGSFAQIYPLLQYNGISACDILFYKFFIHSPTLILLTLLWFSPNILR